MCRHVASWVLAAVEIAGAAFFAVAVAGGADPSNSQEPWGVSRDDPPVVIRDADAPPVEFPVAVSASIDREVRELDQAALKWGREKVLAVTTDRVGSAVQKFVIVVRP